VIQQHIDLYVNDFSRDIGTAGEAAVRAFLEKARASGLMEESRASLFAGPDG
jgi:1,4-dihydroxy-6-naphthoate synthase